MSSELINVELSQLIREISRKIDSILLPISCKNNLTIMKLKVLLEINKNKDSTIGDIGHTLGIAGGNISNMCKILEKEGYLKRTRNSEDERVVTVSLTKQGSNVLNSIREQVSEKFSHYENETTDLDFDQILTSLKDLNQYLDKLVSL